VPTEDIERFEAEFVTLFTLARQQGRHHMTVKNELEAAGVKPAIERDESGQRFIGERGSQAPTQRRLVEFPFANAQGKLFSALDKL
jgi:hypothetical protein